MNTHTPGYPRHARTLSRTRARARSVRSVPAPPRELGALQRRAGRQRHAKGGSLPLAWQRQGTATNRSPCSPPGDGGRCSCMLHSASRTAWSRRAACRPAACSLQRRADMPTRPWSRQPSVCRRRARGAEPCLAPCRENSEASAAAESVTATGTSAPARRVSASAETRGDPR